MDTLLFLWMACRGHQLKLKYQIYLSGVFQSFYIKGFFAIWEGQRSWFPAG